ncbi:MAG TPA: sensor histidine kinase [Actinophytocola sp.]|uniref:sensor histidine kinase n=1 Tax=Actinophytocola sp. TaxID=1872138 RepID=UPI002DB63999|nr:sensor histidine kinase [Actinophytocola sp.]HEU5472212.1 sensor histidine kinase [Actinophytocola sp.]
MTHPHLEEQPWERRETVMLRVMPLGLLGVSTVITLVQPAPSGSELLGTLAVAAVAAAWVLALDTFHPGWKLERRRLPVVYYLGLLVLFAILITQASWYGIFAFTGYFRAFECLPGRWSFAGIAATAVLQAYSQVGGPQYVQAVGIVSFALLALLNITLAAVISYFGWRTIERDRERKQALAELAAALEENAGLHKQLLIQAREAGVLDERQRMAREIHDTLAQGLTGIITQLEAAEARPADWLRHADTAMTLARESLSEARRSVHAVRPVALDNARLPEAIADVVRRWSEINGVPAEVTTTGTARPMHPDVEVTLLRAAQEALANVAKHAGASRVGLTLSYMEDLVTLDVRDDGVGFAPGRASRNGSSFGLTAMRQRVRGLNGRLEIESEPGGGTAVSVSIPAGD